jgi:hypothetical protein
VGGLGARVENRDLGVGIWDSRIRIVANGWLSRAAIGELARTKTSRPVDTLVRITGNDLYPTYPILFYQSYPFSAFWVVKEKKETTPGLFSWAVYAWGAICVRYHPRVRCTLHAAQTTTTMMDATTA